LDADTGKITWYFQETPNEHWDFDTPSPKMLYDVSINGENRKVVANFSRNGFYYTLDRANGQFIRADQYQEKVTWTKGIDLKTGKLINKVTFPPSNESGMLSTDGDILATGHTTGKFSVYDADTLQEVYSFNLGTPITAPPMSYKVGDKQYIAVVIGGGVGLRGVPLLQPS